MTLPNLPANDLAKIDAICLQFENHLRSGTLVSIEEVVSHHSSQYAPILREELRAIEDELVTEGVIPQRDASAGIVKPQVPPQRPSPPSSSALNPTVPPPTGRDPDHIATLAELGSTENSATSDSTTNNDANSNASANRLGNDPVSSLDDRLPTSQSVAEPNQAQTPSIPPEAPATEPRMPPPGEMLGPYEIEERIDQGGMGVVYRAIDTRLRRDVAIKLLTPSLAGRADLVERFDRENRAVAAISHPNIVELFDVGRYGAVPYAVMELLRGRTLGDALKQSRLPAPRMIEIGLALTDALATAHAAGIIHRDLKPNNVMLVPRDAVSSPSSRDGSGPVVKVFDFGLSRVETDSIANAVVGNQQPGDETVEGTILGTPGYMAPEQIHGDRATSKVDLFALGAILFEAWTGEPAFVGENRSRRFAATLESEVQVPEALAKANPEAAEIILRCLAKDPADRPDSALDVHRGLRAAQNRLAMLDIPETSGITNEISRRKWIWAVGGLAAAAGGVAVIGAYTSSPMVIERLAVLSFQDSGTGSTPSSQSMLPVGSRDLRRGEQISTLLVHELSRMPGLSLPAFRPVTAQSPSDYVRLGQQLGVDALLDGKITSETVGTEEFLRWDLRLVNAKTGDEIWSQTLTTQASESLLEQTSVAREIADKIGRRLTPTAQSDRVPDSGAFHCLIDGTARSDPDSTEGLNRSMMCFKKAIEADRAFPDPVGGLALSAMQLAARQQESAFTSTLLRVAQERIDQVLKMDANSRDGRIADAMFRWQTLADFESAESALAQLREELPRDWQVWHQSGLLSMAVGNLDMAISYLLKSSLLNPLSVLVSVDLARANWYAGKTDDAIQDAQSIVNRTDSHPWARGLLVDIYESQKKFALASAMDPGIDETASASSVLYFAARSKRLTTLPYGPFGGFCNQLLWQMRAAPNEASIALASRPAPLPPMLLWIVGSHPAADSLRSLSWIRQLMPRVT